MKYAILADIHGNVTALDAVLRDCKKEQITQFILLGDLFTKGSDPSGVFERLKNLDIKVNVLGNTEEWLFNKAKSARETAMAGYVRESISLDAAAFIDSMQPVCVLQCLGKQLLFIHDRNQLLFVQENQYLSFVYDKMQIDLEINDRLSNSDIVISGHTHIPADELMNQKRFFNPGSVGMPYDGQQNACYGILEVKDQICLSCRNVPYDYKAEIKRAKKNEIPCIQEYCSILESGRKQLA